MALSEAFRTQGSLAIGRRSRVSFEHTLLTAMSSDVLDNWVAQSVRSFLEMDLFAAVQHFLTHAKVTPVIKTPVIGTPVIVNPGFSIPFLRECSYQSYSIIISQPRDSYTTIQSQTFRELSIQV